MIELLNNDPPKPDTYLTELEVREILGLSRQSCYNLRKAGILTCHYAGKEVRYSANEVEAFVLDKAIPTAVPVGKQKFLTKNPDSTVRNRAAPGEPKKVATPKPIATKTPVPQTKPQPASFDDFDNYFI